MDTHPRAGRAWLVDEDGDWGTVVPVDPAHRLYERYHRICRNGDWWTERGYDPIFGRKLPALFERCGLQNIHHDTTAEVVRGTSARERWWLQTLQVMRATDRLADPTRAREEEYAVSHGALERSGLLAPQRALHGCSGQCPS